MTAVQQHRERDRLDHFIPIRKSDIIEALMEQGALASDAERGQYRRLCQTLASIYHYQYFELLERLRNDYYYFSPDSGPHAAMDGELIERSYADLVQSLDRVLKDANFIELPHQDIADAHRRRTVLRVEVEASLDDFREVRFYRRGRHIEQFEVARWFGLRRRKIEAEVYDDVVLMAAMKSHADIASKRELRTLERRKIRPGSVLLKYFRNIATSDLSALFPNARVVMSKRDKIVLSLPAIAGGIPILLNLYATITVLFLVIGFYLGMTAAVADQDMKTALAGLGGLVALGGFVMQQWMKYQRQSLKYQIELTDNVYYRNINNNAGVFDSVIGAAEEQECKEAFLVYHFLHVAASPPTPEELKGRVETWLSKTFGADLDFEATDALGRLERFGLLNRQAGRLSVLPPGGALAQLHGTWDDLFPAETQTATL